MFLGDTVRLMLLWRGEVKVTNHSAFADGRLLVRLSLTREFVRTSDYAKSLGGVILVVEKPPRRTSCARLDTGERS